MFKIDNSIYKKEILRRKRRKRKKIVLGVLSLTVIIFIFSGTYRLSAHIKEKSEKVDMVEEGLLAVRNLENKNVSDIQSKIEKIKQDKQNKMRQESIKKNEKSNTNEQKNRSYKAIFEDTVFMGDSLIEPLDEYNFLSSSSVVATKGRNVITANEKDISSVISLKPRKIVMLYGMNDLGMFKYKNDFINKYKKLIANIRKQLPGTQIYINNIFKTQEKVWLKDKNLRPERITEFNNALKDMCDELKINYIDVSYLVQSNSKLYEPDGIHLIANFYPKWLEQINKKINK
ncbi:hypothetical protein K5V21_12570 [Clostridium sardiniense]|uniref:SGNH hydrolase-type esterase domain-containing protein n=1 Tax=Clostridium sardiniense TaxID=29369 RepID=A0ABS7KZN9_CLOSR|nr:GDSL-type esterase/lipase family protein [Clostridium sardiniense]MBY0756281.1 hypothetical protein [Clostridium sardiniense]MDQ0458775.1 uncharacterized protein YggL (DUF469 family) [Clostridium sardiniense]